MKDDVIAQYVADRDKAVSTMDINVFREFLRKYQKAGFFDWKVLCATNQVLEITMRKMAIHSTNIDPEIKLQAKAWLLDHGCDLKIWGW